MVSYAAGLLATIDHKPITFDTVIENAGKQRANETFELGRHLHTIFTVDPKRLETKDQEALAKTRDDLKKIGITYKQLFDATMEARKDPKKPYEIKKRTLLVGQTTEKEISTPEIPNNEEQSNPASAVEAAAKSYSMWLKMYGVERVSSFKDEIDNCQKRNRPLPKKLGGMISTEIFQKNCEILRANGKITDGYAPTQEFLTELGLNAAGKIREQ